MNQRTISASLSAQQMTPFRRLNFKITLLLVISFVLIVALFLSFLLPFQRGQRDRFVNDRKKFLKNLVTGRRGEICKWWIQDSAAAHWHEFRKILLGDSSILHATLYLRDTIKDAGHRKGIVQERLAVTSDPALVEMTYQSALESGVEFRDSPKEVVAETPFLVAAGKMLWVRTEQKEGMKGEIKQFRTRLAPRYVQEVGLAPFHRIDTRGSRRSLHFCSLIYLGAPNKKTFGRVGHLVVQYSLEDLAKEESSIFTLFYGLVGALFLVLVGLLNISLGRSVVMPIRKVLDAMRKAGAGDLETRLEKRSRDEIGMMADRFNQMVQDLKHSKEAIEEYSRTLEQRVEDRTSKLRKSERHAQELKDHLTAVLRHVQAGVFALDPAGRIVTFNERAGELLGLDPDKMLGRPMEEVFEASTLDSLYRFIQKKRGVSAAMEEIKMGPPGKGRTLRVAVTPLAGGGEVVVVDDVTELIYSKRLLAWREAVERVIHDIKNPLTPVRLSAQQIRVAFEDQSPDLDHILDKGTANILSSIDNLQSMLANFSLLYRRPRAQPGPVDLNGLLARVLEEQAPTLDAGIPDAGITLVTDLKEGLPSVMGDSLSLWRLMSNVVQNGLEAMEGRTGRFTVRTELAGAFIRVLVMDEGHGIPPDRLDKLFEPYFTTKGKGTGLGLVIARQIVDDHGGTIEIRSGEKTGTVVEIQLPLDA